MGSIRTCLLQEGTSLLVNKDLSFRGRHIIWVNRYLSVRRRQVI